MKTRIISAIVAIPLLLFFVIYGGLPLQIAVLLLSLVGMYELNKAVSGHFKAVHIFGYIMELIYFAIVMYVLNTSEPVDNLLGLMLIMLCGFIVIFIVLFLLILITLVFDHKNCNIHDGSITVFGFFYVGLLLSLICFVRVYGMYYVWLPFIFAFVSDTGAYFVGSFMGKHKLTPELSPKKTIEGSVGGVISVAIFTLIYTVLFNKFAGTDYSMVLYVIAGLVGAVLSQIGDLAASSIKRYTGIKDYGKLMPGHGGVLDRFDSVLFTIPVVFIVMIIERLINR